MANHCNNFVTFNGSEDNIRQLVNKFNNCEKTLWRDLFYEFVNLDINPNADVYKEFGTKWFDPYVQAEQLSGDDSYITISGESAWSPIIEFAHKICKQFNVTAEGEYDEGGLDFGGFYEIDSAGNVSDREYNYLTYRYLSEGIEGVYNELEFYIEDETINEVIKRLDDVKDVMSDKDYAEMFNHIMTAKL